MPTQRPLIDLLNAIDRSYDIEGLSGLDDCQMQRLIELGERTDEIRALLLRRRGNDNRSGDAAAHPLPSTTSTNSRGF